MGSWRVLMEPLLHCLTFPSCISHALSHPILTLSPVILTGTQSCAPRQSLSPIMHLMIPFSRYRLIVTSCSVSLVSFSYGATLGQVPSVSSASVSAAMANYVPEKEPSVSGIDPATRRSEGEYVALLTRRGGPTVRSSVSPRFLS